MAAHARRPSSRERKPTWRAAIRTVQAGMAFKKIFQKLPNEIMQDNFSPEALKVLKVSSVELQFFFFASVIDIYHLCTRCYVKKTSCSAKSCTAYWFISASASHIGEM